MYSTFIADWCVRPYTLRGVVLRTSRRSLLVSSHATSQNLHSFVWILVFITFKIHVDEPLWTIIIGIFLRKFNNVVALSEILTTSARCPEIGQKLACACRPGSAACGLLFRVPKAGLARSWRFSFPRWCVIKKSFLRSATNGTNEESFWKVGRTGPHFIVLLLLIQNSDCHFTYVTY